MKLNPGHRAPDTRISRAVGAARKLVEAQYTSRALVVLEALRQFPLQPIEEFHVEALRIRCWIDQGRISEAADALVSLGPLARSVAQDDALDLLRADCDARGGRVSQALKTATSVLRRVGKQSEDAAKCYRIIGIALYRAAHYRWAQEALEMSAAIYRLAGNKVDLAQVLGNIGLVHKNLGRTSVALTYLDEAARILPKRGHRWTRLHSLEYRGICFIRLGQISEARATLLTARGLAHSIRQDLVTIAADNNLGHIYRMEGNYATAREFYEEALRAARAAKTPRKEALALEFLGETCIEEGRPAEAIPLLEQALALATPLAGHGDVVMEVLRRRGEAKLALGNRAEGLEDLQRSIDLCGARKERRERALAQRSFDIASTMPLEEFASRSSALLRELQDLGDRFEYARTVCLLLEDARLDPAQHPWLADAQTTAMHYFSSLGLRAWKDRLQRVAGHAHRIRPEPISSTTAHNPESHTRSAPYAFALEASRIAARSREPALILGETGSGKEVIARLVHGWSARASGSLVAINCGAIPEALIESELFGHVRGAFTGADRDRAGLFESSTGGTVLLDEMGDLPPGVQVKLLRFLDSYEFRRVGEHRVRQADVRILAATHKDLRRLVEQGTFREDLFYRLKVFQIDVPPLRDRREDIPALVDHFFAEEWQSSLPLHISADLLKWMAAYQWPGNVRELRNLCRYLSARCWGKPEVGVRDLPPDMLASCMEFLAGTDLSAFQRDKLEFERLQIIKALQQSNGSISEASRLLRMGRNQVARKIRDYGISRDSFRPSAP